MSIKSANETEYHLLKARDRVLTSPDDWQRFSGETIEIRKMIYTYRLKRLRGRVMQEADGCRLVAEGSPLDWPSTSR